MVLGARVYSAERMSVSLSNRVDKAYEYLAENPEPCASSPEARAGRALPRGRHPEKRLGGHGHSGGAHLCGGPVPQHPGELQFAKEIAEEQGMGRRVAVVTQGFHMYRAIQLAKAAGFTPYSLVAETDPLLFPEYYGRELLSLTKWQVEHLLLD